MDIGMTLLGQALTFALLIAFTAKFIWPPLMAAIEEGNRQKAAALAEIESATARAREDLRKQVSMLAVAGAEQLIRREIDGNAHRALLDELAAEI